MKKYTATLLLLGYAACISAQQDPAPEKPFTFGARGGYFSSPYNSGLNYYGAVTVSRNIHELSLGPSFGRTTYFNSYHNQTYNYNYRLNGIDLTYRIYPEGRGKIFDFYFQFDYQQKWSKGRATVAILTSTNPYSTTDDQVKLKSNACFLMLEFGFDIKFLKRFYIGNSIGGGGSFDFRNYRYETYSQLSNSEIYVRLPLVYRTCLGVRF